VIHSLWDKGDKNPLILPALVPIDDPRVQFELTRYLSDNWVPVIEKDVDGQSSLPHEFDKLQSLGKYHATRRVARTIYLGSAPTAGAAHRGIEDRQVKLGCVMPGEPPGTFGDALRRLAGAATYLYQDGTRYWYSTQPTVTKLAEDRADQLRREPDKVAEEIGRRLKHDLTDRGGFSRVHALPASSQEVSDEPEAGLVVLGLDDPYTKDGDSPAELAARKILETRGNAPRILRNTLVFLAADRSRLQELEEAVCKYLAWESILGDSETLDLTPFQVKQATTQRDAATGAVTARIPETFQWLLVPQQADPQAEVTWEAYRLSGQERLAVRAARKLRNDELLITSFGPTRLRMELDRVPLWRGEAKAMVPVRQLIEDFARYLYLPRVAGPRVIAEAIGNGLGLLTWEKETFAYADSYDEAEERFRGLRGGERIPISETDPGLLVRPDVARAQLDVEIPPSKPGAGDMPTDTAAEADAGGYVSAPPTALPRRYFGTVDLDPLRVGLEASRIADEVLGHLTGQPGSKVRITLDIEAELPEGAPDTLVRVVTENGRTLKFKSQGFEKE